MYLLVFSGKHNFCDETTFIDHLKIAIEQSEDFCVEEVSIVQDSLIDLLFRSIAQDEDGSIPEKFSFDIMKLKFKTDFDFQIKPDFDAFLLESIQDLREPVGAQFFYNIEDGNVIKIHTFSRFLLNNRTIDNDYIHSLEAVIEHADLLYNKLYKGRILEEHQPQVAKIILSLKSDKISV